MKHALLRTLPGRAIVIGAAVKLVVFALAFVMTPPGFLRIIDESGDDYLYPRTYFRALVLPQSVKKAVLAAA